MKKLITFSLAILLAGINVIAAANKTGLHNPKDTLSIKCLLFSPDLFYGIELGEKPVRDMVDTLVGEINMYDTARQLNLVILSGRDLGFTNQQDILWQQIIDSATNKGYGVCPPQAGPEIYVLSQNMKRGHALLAGKISNGRPIFIGMNKLSTGETHNSSGSLFGYDKHEFNYIFCLKRNGHKNDYTLGYSATGMVKGRKKYAWSSSDLFIFTNKNQPPNNSHIIRYCISGAVVGK